MKEFKAFYFESFRFESETLKAYFLYSFDKAEFFEEEIDFRCSWFELRKDFDETVFASFLFQIHLALGISYYKLYPTKDLFIWSGYLTDTQIAFWEKFYKNWLWEFLYKNNIPPQGLFQFHKESDIVYPKQDIDSSEKSLVPLGGGKDSMVSIVLLEEAWYQFDTVVFWKMDTVKTQISDQLKENNLLITRKMSQNLFKLNDLQYYNGHVPITGIIAFVLYASAYLYDYKYIIMSNERSADEGNMIWQDFEINHQYSKSLEFERDLRAYTQQFLVDSISYFSLLRGMYEYKIAEIFSKNCRRYFKTFASCNKNFFINSHKTHAWNWCLSCEKCAFVFLILSAHLDEKDLLSIFWENLFLKKDLEQTFLDLLGIGDHKPFECVGTNEESVFALYKYFENNTKQWKLYGIFEEKILSQMSEFELYELEKKLREIWTDDNIPLKVRSDLLFAPQN